jgi:hypothetical protein
MKAEVFSAKPLIPAVRGTHASKIAKRGAASIVMVPTEIKGGPAASFFVRA